MFSTGLLTMCFTAVRDMCRGWRVALPKVMLCANLMVDCRKRMVLKQLERDKAEAVRLRLSAFSREESPFSDKES